MWNKNLFWKVTRNLFFVLCLTCFLEQAKLCFRNLTSFIFGILSRYSTHLIHGQINSGDGSWRGSPSQKLHQKPNLRCSNCFPISMFQQKSLKCVNTIITRHMCMISLIWFTDKHQIWWFILVTLWPAFKSDT